MDAIEIVLPGLPRGKGRPRFAVRGKHAVAYTDDKTASFEGALRMAGGIAMGGRQPLDGAVSLIMTAVFPIPASWSKTKRADANVGNIRPTGKPDVDNLLKCVDGLNGVVWRDDAQIVRATVIKRYGSSPETVISVQECLP
jgi:Holliday junction resolvase RusA-like endonuclease